MIGHTLKERLGKNKKLAKAPFANCINSCAKQANKNEDNFLTT
jgi:hypothetical protein